MTITLLSSPPRRRHSRPEHQIYSSMVRMNADGYPVNEPEPKEPPKVITPPRSISRATNSARHEHDHHARAVRIHFHTLRIAGGQ